MFDGEISETDEASQFETGSVFEKHQNMSYFRERNQTRNEYSGYQDISDGLRSRLANVSSHYIAHGYIASEGRFIPARLLNHEIQLHLDKSSITEAMTGTYDEVFEAVEIFLAQAERYARYRYREISADIANAFDIAGSVYCLDLNTGRIELRVDDKLAQDIDAVSSVLSQSKDAQSEFLDSVGGLMGRTEKPENVVSGIFIAFEDYLKNKTGTKDYNAAVTEILNKGLISKTQKALLDKIYAYRSDTYGVGHAGNSEKPEEIDSLWFLETVTAQILFIDRKLKNSTSEVSEEHHNSSE